MTAPLGHQQHQIFAQVMVPEHVEEGTVTRVLLHAEHRGQAKVSFVGGSVGTQGGGGRRRRKNTQTQDTAICLPKREVKQLPSLRMAPQEAISLCRNSASALWTTPSCRQCDRLSAMELFLSGCRVSSSATEGEEKRGAGGARLCL